MDRCWIDGRAGRVVYEPVRELAHGAHGQVFLARAEDGSFAALKVAVGRVDRASIDFSIEERIAAQLDHPNVVRLLGRGVDAKGRPVLAYERVYENPLLLISRPDVRSRLPQDPGSRFYPLPPGPALSLAADLLRGLEHLHHRSFVHHDVKLANVMVRLPARDGDVPESTVLDRFLAGATPGVLVDFGATRSAAFLEELNRGEVADARLAPSQLTPIYAPPETLDPGRSRFGPSLDVYAAALVIYSCLSGRAPYDHVRGVDTGDLEQLRQVKARERSGGVLPVSLEALEAAPATRAIAGDLHGFLIACSSRDPGERPTVTDARRHVERLLRLVGAPGRRAPRTPGRDVFFGRRHDAGRRPRGPAQP